MVGFKSFTETSGAAYDGASMMTRAMILAAGRGSRLSPLTDTCPKPLLPVRGRPLIEYTLEALAQAGVQEVVINVSYLKEQFFEVLENGHRFGLTIQYSVEEEALETGGGIFQALPLLGEDPFLLVGGDILTNYPFQTMQLPKHSYAHLLFVPNPPHNLKGDFDCQNGIVSRREGLNPFTYGAIATLSPKLFEGCKQGKYRLIPLCLKAMEQGCLTAEVYEGYWQDIGSLPSYEEAQHGIRA